MRQMLITLTTAASLVVMEADARQLDISKYRSITHQLDDVMEITDTIYLKAKLTEVETVLKNSNTELNKVRTGIVYHEVALSLSSVSKEYKGYALKSFEILTQVEQDPNVTKELLPFISTYRASALSLVSAETNKIKLLNDAFTLINLATEKYATLSYAPEFFRGSISENLPWFFFRKKKYAKKDFQSIISKQEKDENYADGKIMSFTYWAWAKQHQAKKDRKQAMEYLDRAIALDPDYKAGRKKAEELKEKLKG